MSLRQCAFLTMEDPDGFFVYDEVTYGPLKQIGWHVTEVPWSKPDRPWSEFECAIIRSTWDYQDRPDDFLRTLEAIESAGVHLLNPRDVCQWNMDKVYLRQLHEAGVPTIPTEWHDCLTSSIVAASLERFESAGKIVVKPRIGANADNIFVLENDAKTWQTALDVFANQALMIQPFLNSICERGEFSLFYFASEYSHAILKQPKAGDFRVQEEHGGQIVATQANAELQRIGLQTIKAIGHELLYARIDLVEVRPGNYALIEAELIEPSLYFTFDDGSPLRFARALDRMLS